LKQLYGIYGDWNLALAAYNAGPGNVNHAIKRSGGKTTYWEVRPFLPQETQGYVPNFIAAAYLITYHAEHNIIPMEAKVHNAQLDTMCMKNGVHMNTISQIASWDLEEIKALNPVYKTAFIPKMSPARCLTGPMDKINLLVSFEDSLYALEKFLYAPKPPVPKPVLVVPQDSLQNIDTASLNTIVVDSLKPTNENLQYHKVKAGENLKNIALKYNVTIEQIMEWNGLQTTNIYVGQKRSLQHQHLHLDQCNLLKNITT
jgi:membrane-bound lytic murein transglycosylase D